MRNDNNVLKYNNIKMKREFGYTYWEPQITLQRAARGSRAAGWKPLSCNIILLFTDMTRSFQVRREFLCCARKCLCNEKIMNFILNLLQFTFMNNSGADVLFTKVFLNINVIPFQIVPLGSYWPMETLFPLLVGTLENFNRYDLQHVRYMCLESSWQNRQWARFH